MELAQDRKDLEDYLKLFAPQVQRNLEIMSIDDFEARTMLHIDIEGSSPKKFYPRLSQRAALSENVNVPRVTVADTLLGCMIAYSAMYFDFTGDKVPGYEINSFKFTHCLKPTNKLVYDQEVTGEHWLVGYNKPSSFYIPVRIGSVFMIKMEIERGERNGKMLTMVNRTTIVLDIKERLLLQPKRWIEPGFHLLTINVDMEHHLSYDDESPVKIEKISQGEFNKYRSKHSPDLALEQMFAPKTNPASGPLFNRW